MEHQIGNKIETYDIKCRKSVFFFEEIDLFHTRLRNEAKLEFWIKLYKLKNIHFYRLI